MKTHEQWENELMSGVAKAVTGLLALKIKASGIVLIVDLPERTRIIVDAVHPKEHHEVLLNAIKAISQSQSQKAYETTE
jgi:hypothetical protein